MKLLRNPKINMTILQNMVHYKQSTK